MDETQDNISPIEHNEKLFSKVSGLLSEVEALKSEMLPVESVPQASLAECNELSRINRKGLTEAAKEGKTESKQKKADKKADK